LAPLVVSALLEVFSELRADGTSLLLVEEKLRAVVGIADVVTFLRLGEVTWSGPAAEVTESHVARYYLTPHEHQDGGDRPGSPRRPLTTA
jgi:ABC-type branched-subunit amino acid transport system ATPase component